MKRCIKCKCLVPLDSFRIDRRTKDGRQGRCKACSKMSDAKFRQRNSGSIKIQQKSHYAENSDRIKARAKQWEKDNPEYVCLRKKRYREENKDRIAENDKKYRIRNKDKLNCYMANYRKTRLASDPDFQASASMHRILHRTMRQTTGMKTKRTFELLGYTATDLRDHLESQFQPGMTWGNRGEWHIDHIKPISLFIKEGETDPSVINALSNLQPLWALDNLRKGAKYEQSVI